MKTKTGIIIGFVAGMAGFLMLFKFLFLDRIPPEDEVPPGIVMITAIGNGILCAFVGRWIQNRYRKKNI